MRNTMENIYVKIAGTGSYLPGDPISIENVVDILGGLDEAPKKLQRWLKNAVKILKELLDVEYYHYAIDPVTKKYTDDNITMSVKAAKKALENAKMNEQEIDLIVYGAVYMHQMPTPSVLIQDALGITHCAELSVHANCTSAYKALMIAQELIQSGRYRNALVISSNIPSALVRADYYNQQLVKKEDIFLRYYFCDGAGGIVLKAEKEKSNGFYLEESYIESIGGKKPVAMGMKLPGYFMCPKEIYENGLHHQSQMFQEKLQELFMEDDRSIFFRGLERMVKKRHIDLSNLKFFNINMPSKHVVNFIMDECKELGIKEEQVYSSISGMGYTGPPAVFITTDHMISHEKFNNDDLILSFVTEVSKFMQAGFTVRYYN